MMVKKTVGSSRRTRYKRRLIQLLDMADEPLSHHEIITYTQQWKHGIPTTILSNILSKDEAFEIYGTVKSANALGSQENWTVNTYILSPIGVELAATFPGASACPVCKETILFTADKPPMCSGCYLKKKEEERKNA
jgi:phenylpropionate dioxygenase-like ring-hydroxylating dioxygenase large terminal subunit